MQILHPFVKDLLAVKQFKYNICTCRAVSGLTKVLTPKKFKYNICTCRA